MSSVTQDSSIAATLRDDILRGQYRRGERLPSERDLAERFGVHRSTVRAAFKRLEQLGIADIRQGGARVNPIEEASLDVVEHLLALENPPNPELVDQTLEAMSGFLAMAARLGAERANAEQRGAMLDVVEEMITGRATEERRGELVSALGEAFVEASGNMVLGLVRHGLRTRYSNYVLPEDQRHSAPMELMEEPLRQLADAIRSGRGADASEAILALTTVTRRHIRSHLEAQRPRGSDGNRPNGSQDGANR